MQSRTGGLPRWSMGRDSGQRARRGGGPERESDDESKSDDELKRETLVLTQNTAMRHRRGVFNRGDRNFKAESTDDWFLSAGFDFDENF